MAAWRVQVLGPLAVLKDGQPQRLRTRHQSLLLGRLAAYGGQGVPRDETAELLWPDADRSLALTYLRKAIMELRRLGIEIVRDGDRLRLDPLTAASDFEELQAGIRQAQERGDQETIRRLCSRLSETVVMESTDHKIADEARALVHDYVLGLSSRIVQAHEEPDQEPAGLSWLGDAIVLERPDIAVELLARHGRQFAYKSPPDKVLNLILRTLSVCPTLSQDRLTLCLRGAWIAVTLTKYSAAKRLFEEVIRDCPKVGADQMVSAAYGGLTFMLLEQRAWDEGLEYGRRATEAADKTGNRFYQSVVYQNLGSIQWHMNDMQSAVKNYCQAWEHTQAEDYPHNTQFPPAQEMSEAITANLTYIWAVFGAEVEPRYLPSAPAEYGPRDLYIQRTYLNFGYGIARQDVRLAADSAGRFLEFVAANGMDRLICVGIDCCAIALARLGRHTEAVVAMRLGSHTRRQISHGRSPAEYVAMRRHVPTPYFSAEIEARLRPLMAAETPEAAQQIARLVRSS